ncbi:NB-ARC domain-containing protein [Nocardia gipuzkoensis]
MYPRNYTEASTGPTTVIAPYFHPISTPSRFSASVGPVQMSLLPRCGTRPLAHLRCRDVPRDLTPGRARQRAALVWNSGLLGLDNVELRFANPFVADRGRAVNTVPRWTGREARALREAMRMTVREFASRLGIDARTVSKWEAGWERHVPGPDSQAILDTVLRRADAAEIQRFKTLAVDLPRRRLAPSARSVLAPPPEGGLIDRQSDCAAVVSLLTHPHGDDTTVAVCGPGGFGKTTLAKQVCADPQIRQRFSEIVWVETGQDCTPARLVELISDLCVHLHGQRPALNTPEQAGFHLARIAQTPNLLLVIDNVWSATDLAPFLLAPCTRLVTTRNLRTCPSTTHVVRLGPMTAAEISELLSRAVARLPRHYADQLSGLCGGWPLLATVVGSTVGADLEAGAPPQRAVHHAHQALTDHGVQALDIWDSDQRNNAIGHAITASLTSLEEDVRITEGPGLRERYLSLAVFPGATAVPVDVLTHWWCTAYDWSPPAVRQFCRILADRSLISAYLADRDVVVLHDVFRSYLSHLLGDDAPGTHRSLIDAYRENDSNWHTLSSEHRYLWQNLTYHLREASLDVELIDVLSSPSYIVAKASQVGSQVLTADAAILRSLGDYATATHPRHQAWSAAVTMTETSFLLHGLQSAQDMAATLSVALTRGGHIGTLRGADHASVQPFSVMWTGINDGEQLRGHTGAVVSISASADLLASGGEDGTVRIWDATNNRILHVLRAHTGWVFATALSSQGQVLASAGEDGQIRLWKPQTGQPIGVLRGHARRIRAVCFTPDNQLLVSAAEDGCIHVSDISQRKLTQAMATCGTPLWTVAVDATGTMVAAAGEDEWLRLYDLATGALLDEVAAHRDWVRTVAFAPTGPLLASGSGDQSVIVWNTSNRKLEPIQKINDLPARVRAVTWDHHGVLLAATEDAVIRSFDDSGPAAHIAMPAGVDWIRALACLASGAIYAGCEDGAVRRWNTSAPDRLVTIAEGADTIWSTNISTDATTATLGHGDGRIELFNNITNELSGTLDGSAGRIWSLASGGDRIAAACGDGTIRVWSRHDQHPILNLNDDMTRTWAVAITKPGDRLAASLGDGRIRCWTLPTGRLLWERQARAGRVRSLTFDAAGKLIAMCGGDGTVHLWDASTGNQHLRFTNPGGWARLIALDNTGSIVAVGSGTGDIHIRDTRIDRFTEHLRGHSGRVLMLTFLDGTDILLSAAADGTVRAWSLHRGVQLAEIRVDAALNCAAADPTTGRVLAAGPAGPVLLLFDRTTFSAPSESAPNSSAR